MFDVHGQAPYGSRAGSVGSSGTNRQSRLLVIRMMGNDIRNSWVMGRGSNVGASSTLKQMHNPSISTGDFA